MTSRRRFFYTAVSALAGCGGGVAPASARIFAVYGDSISSGVHSSDYNVWTPARWSPTPVEAIASELPAWRAIDYSRAGMSAAEAVIGADVADLVVLRFGTADAIYGTDMIAFTAAVERLARQARVLGQRVIITGLPHTATGAEVPYDSALRALALRLGIPFVDVHALAFDPATDLADPIHPALPYSRRIGALVAAAIRSTS